MKLIPVLACLLVLVFSSTTGEAQKRGPVLTDSILRVTIWAGFDRMSGGSAVMTEDGLYTAKHVAERIGAGYGHRDEETGEFALDGHVAGIVTGPEGLTRAIKGYEQVGGRDVVKLILKRPPPPNWHPLKIGAQPAPGARLRAVGFYSEVGFEKGILAIGIGYMQRAVKQSMKPGYFYEGPIYHVSTPACRGMSGGAILNSRGEVVALISYTGGASADYQWGHTGVWPIR